MSKPNSFKKTSKEKEILIDIMTLLKNKNRNPSNIKDLKYLLNLIINPDYKSFKSEYEYLLIFLLKHLNDKNEQIFNEYFFKTCEIGKIENVKIFLENKINVNCQNEQGETPLHIAISKDDIELINLLIKYEPDTSLATYKEGLTAMNYAEFRGDKKIIEIIEELTEKQKKKKIQNEIANCISNGLNNINENINNYILQESSSFLSKNNTINLNQIQNYNGDIISIIGEEDKSLSSFANKNMISNSENKYLATQTIINESDYYEENSPINKDLSSIKKYSKNSKPISVDKKLIFPSINKKEEMVNNNIRTSINPSYIQSLTTCHTLNKDHFESNPPLPNNMSLKQANRKANLFKFIQEINLPKEYANNLIDNGFDVLDVLIYQAKKGIAFTYQNLKDIGIKLPGERAKILVHLEEIAGNFDFQFDKELVYSNKIDNYKNSSLFKFLSEINCQKYIKNFINGGYYTSELLLLQMISKEPLTEEILINDLGLDTFVSKEILGNLNERSQIYCKNMSYIDKNIEENKNKLIILEGNNNIKSCDMCLLF